MPRPAILVVMLGTSFMTLSASASTPTLVKTQIEGVTVYADRAQVTRVGSADLTTAGGGELVIAGLPGWIDHESIRVTLSRGVLLDVATRTTHLAQSAEQTVRKAQQAVVVVLAKIKALNDEREIIRGEVNELKRFRAFVREKLPRDVARRRVKMSEVAEGFDFVAKRLTAAKARLRALDEDSRKLDRERRKLESERNELRAKSQLKQTEVVIGFKGQGKSKVTLVYMTPGAVWEPGAELRVDGRDRASLVQHATVVNTTGEDWTNAALAFSTQRPGEMLTVPVAKALLVGAGGKPLGEVVGTVGSNRGASFSRASSMYVQQNMVVQKQTSRWQEGFRRQQEAQRRALDAFRALKERGTTAHFKAKVKRAIRSNGRPVRVPITDNTYAMKTQLVAVPEVSLNAVRTAELTNTAKTPILPGIVSLFVDGMFLGKSRLKFVAPGEGFSAFLGVDNRVKITRTMDRARSKMERGSKRTAVTASWVVRVYNLSSEPLKIALSDRVPVAGSDAIEIDDVKIPRGASRSRDGLVRWTVSLGPKKSGAYRVQYTMEYPNQLAQKARTIRKKRKSRRGRAPNPAPSKSNQEYLFDAIDDLEKAF